MRVLSLLDLRLGLRMLVKYPALSMVGGLGMAVGVALSVGFFAFMQAHFFPTIPLPEGDRIVAVENRDTRLYAEDRRALHDFAVWRNELRTVQDVGAFLTTGRTLVAGNGAPEPIAIAEITASGFTVARVAPLMGRALTAADEAPGAAPVVVIGHRAWTERFRSDPHVVGTTVRLGGTAHTIVGVMPEGFAFPFNHSYWTPLRADPASYPRRKGPSIFVFGRLAPGATMSAANAEIAVLGKRAAADFPRTNATLVPTVMPYAHSLTRMQGTTKIMGIGMQALMSILLLIVTLNVAVLVYARTAARAGEIAIRNALGASRGRIVRGLFAEGLVLSVISSAAGLGLAQFGLRYANGLMEKGDGSYGTPFWATTRLEPETVLFTLGVAVFTATIIGVIPALQTTGRALQQNLRRIGGGTGLGLGKTWTALIVVQVAVAAFALPSAVSQGWGEIRNASTSPTYEGAHYLVTDLRIDGSDGTGAPSPADSVAFAGRVEEIMRRVAAEPEVQGVTYRTISLARVTDMRGGRIETDGVALPADLQSEWAVESHTVAPNMLATFGARALSGRTFEPADADSASTAIVVSASFAGRAFGSASALGKRVRYAGREAFADDPATPPSRWYTIVGVAGDLEENPLDPREVTPAIYHASGLAGATYVQLQTRTRGRASDFVPTLRRHIVAVDPEMRFGGSQSLDSLETQNALAKRLVALVVGLVLLSVSLLSAAGVYALTSFTVTRRRREIGIRAALGAGPTRVLRDIFTRVARQVALGLALGIGGAGAVDALTDGALLGGLGGVLLPVFAALMTIVALVAATGPARRGLRVDPAEALRSEA